MKITKLHLILITVVLLVTAFFANQFRKDTQKEKELKLVEMRRQAELRMQQDQNRQNQDGGKKRELAIKAVAVAGEYWMITKKEGRDYTEGQQTLRAAKEYLAQEDYENALALAKQSITEFKSASFENLEYVVIRGDSLWGIAKMSRHYGKGSEWVKIWRANEKKIPDFDLIYSGQVLVIPKHAIDRIDLAKAIN